MEYQTLKMDVDEDIEIFVEKYVKARKAVDIDGYEAAKYFLALPFRVDMRANGQEIWVKWLLWAKISDAR